MDKVLGIIAEYNPFHNGHLYHLEDAKVKADADYVVAIITGNFTQRGSTSIVNKWDKAEMALKNGVDLVIELPTLYSVSSAENFSNGAIKILNKMEIIDSLAFGMETDDISVLNNIANLLYKEPKKLKSSIKEELKEGLSYPAARQKAVVQYTKELKYADILSGSNNILAIEYLKSLKTQKSKIIPIGIKREKVFYNSNKIVDEYASATGIRKLLERNQIDDVSRVVPRDSFNIIMKNIEEGTFNVNLNKFSKEIMYKLRSMSVKEISELPEVSEGLHNLIKTASGKTNDVEELIELIKSKRYTQTRIQRIMIYALLGIKKSDMEMSKKVTPYVRVLGFNQNGKNLLAKISPKVKVITSSKKFEKSNTNKSLKRMFEIDKLATDIYTLGYKNKSVCNLDYTQNMVIEE